MQEDFLEFCQFVMKEASSNCNGILLRGSTTFEHNAWRLLRLCNYNYNLAKFWILNAEEMAIPSLRDQYIAVF